MLRVQSATIVLLKKVDELRVASASAAAGVQVFDDAGPHVVPICQLGQVNRTRGLGHALSYRTNRTRRGPLANDSSGNGVLESGDDRSS
jgi:hypothetical protein